jgi:hypothetical protein
MKDGFLGGISDIQEQLLYYCALAFEFEPLLVNDKMAIKTIVNIILKINPSIMDKYKLLSSTLRSIQNYAISQ